MTLVGTMRAIEVPSPSWPYVLVPQQYASPARVRPHVWLKPIEIVMNCSPPTTSVGTVRMLLFPLPSTPLSLFPQQYARPSLVRPQLRFGPTVSCA